jgi:hypothetical protein
MAFFVVWRHATARLSQHPIAQPCPEGLERPGRLLSVELVLPPGNDLGLLKGRERTEAEYRDLLASAGFRLTRVIATRSGASVVEAVRA